MIAPRPKERRRVTLIATFRGYQGFAVCADSQETITQFDENGDAVELRRAVQKITPVKTGNCQVSIAGGGNATLIEAFIVRARRRLQTENLPSPRMEDVHRIVEDELALFYRNDVALCTDTDKGIKLFVAAACQTAMECDVWISEGILLRPVAQDRPELLGWNHELYHKTAEQLFEPNMRLSRAALASIYVVTTAKKTSNYVGGELTVATVKPNGIWIEEHEYVESMEARLDSYERAVGQLFLDCADTEISPKLLEARLGQFAEGAQKEHRKHLDAEVAKMQSPDGGMILYSNPLARIPPGTMISVDRNGKIFNVDFDPPPPTKEQQEVPQRYVEMDFSKPKS